MQTSNVSRLILLGALSISVIVAIIVLQEFFAEKDTAQTQTERSSNDQEAPYVEPHVDDQRAELTCCSFETPHGWTFVKRDINGRLGKVELRDSAGEFLAEIKFLRMEKYDPAHRESAIQVAEWLNGNGESTPHFFDEERAYLIEWSPSDRFDGLAYVIHHDDFQLLLLIQLQKELDIYEDIETVRSSWKWTDTQEEES